MAVGEPAQELAAQLDEGNRDVPPSTATSVDSRAALLSSFWDTMSTDHASGDADDGNGIMTPAHAGQCISGPRRDVAHQAGTALGGQLSPAVCGEVMAQTTEMAPSSQNLKDSEFEIRGSYGKIALQSTGADQDDTQPPLKRPSLHLRMASLSPTLAASPGAELLNCVSWDVYA